MPIKIGSVTLEHIIIDSVEMSKIDIGATTVFELVSNYTVNFIANGSIFYTETVAAGGTIARPSTRPIRSNGIFGSNCVFIKWVYGVSNTELGQSTVVNSNMDVYAYWFRREILRQGTCSKCSGSGYAYNDVECPECLGLGSLNHCGNCYSTLSDWDMYNGFCPICGMDIFYGEYPYSESECWECNGSGYLYEYGICDVCNGYGEEIIYSMNWYAEIY